MRKNIQGLLGMEACNPHENFLACLYLLGRIEKLSFFPIEKKVWKKLQLWKEKLFFINLRDRSTYQSCCYNGCFTYIVSVVWIHSSFCKDFQAMMARFWLRGGYYLWNIHWKHWEKWSIPKTNCGIEFKDSKAFN